MKKTVSFKDVAEFLGVDNLNTVTSIRLDADDAYIEVEVFNYEDNSNVKILNFRGETVKTTHRIALVK